MLLALAVALPLTTVLLLGKVQAQLRPPNQPPAFNPPKFNPPPAPQFKPPQFNPPKFDPPKFDPPKFNVPQFIHVWKCSRCGGHLGNGSAPLARCPSCGAQIINGVGANQVQVPATRSGGARAVLCALGALAGLGMTIGGIITALKCARYF
jgi:hypothetical protein